MSLYIQSMEIFNDAVPVEITNLLKPDKSRLSNIRVGDVIRNETALKMAYSLSCLSDQTPRDDLSVPSLKGYFEEQTGDSWLKRYTNNPKSPNLGILITDIDVDTGLHGEPKRLVVDSEGNPTLWRMGEDHARAAIATRAVMFAAIHNPEMYQYLIDLRSGSIPHIPRDHKKRSPAIEELIKAQKRNGVYEDDEGYEVLGAASFGELGYSRRYTDDRILSRREALKGLYMNSTGVPSSIFGLGGMPPVTGESDVIMTAALFFMRSWIPRNSLFVDSERQIAMFIEVRDRIQKLDLPTEIEDMALRQIGVSLGAENPKDVSKYARELQELGCRAVRIYTTSTDMRTVQATESIRQKCGDDMVICVAPIVDLHQARQLVSRDRRADIILVGHGGGRNCTSLEGGGTANQMELLYGLATSSDFVHSAIGVEGGTGSSVGPIAGMVDVISLNGRVVAGGIEIQGGLFAEHVNGLPVQPYPGSASVNTQKIESLISDEVRTKRLSDDGMVIMVEGKADYMEGHKAVVTIGDNIRDEQVVLARTITDQGAQSIYELREVISKHGYGHRIVTPQAAEVAGDHRINR